jgi:hypothetical protein
MSSPDMMRDMCIQQGYVPATCYLPGAVVYSEVKHGRDPCAGCNLDRAICHGRPRRDEWSKE